MKFWGAGQVLDIACGPGYAGASALQKGAFVIGIDFSAAMVEKATSLHPKIDFHVMDAEKLEFGDATFNVALMNFGILHFADPKQAIKEAFRVLKPNGKFLYTIWNRPEAFEMIFESVSEAGDLSFSLPEGPDFYQFQDKETARQLLLQTGFRSVEVEDLDQRWELDSPEEFFQAFYGNIDSLNSIFRENRV